MLARAVTTDLSVDYGADGLAVHIAARLEKIADDGGIALSHSTWKSARHFIDVESLGLTTQLWLDVVAGLWG